MIGAYRDPTQNSNLSVLSESWSRICKGHASTPIHTLTYLGEVILPAIRPVVVGAKLHHDGRGGVRHGFGRTMHARTRSARHDPGRNGPEFVSKALDRWAYENGATLDFSRAGKTADNANVGSFNGRLRD